MKLKLIRLFVLTVFCLISVNTIAQDEYRSEIGGNIGGSYYLGEANNQLFNFKDVAYSGFLRYCFTPRLAAKVEVTNTYVVGPDFRNNVFAADFTGEFNFFDLEKNEYKQFSKTFSPYIFAGIGGIYYSGILNPSIPFGLGIKVKLGKRWNLNAQWTTRLLLADNLENLQGLNNPNGINGTNPFNNDILSTLTVGISFDIWKKQCDCENSSVKKDSHKFKKK